MLTQGVGCKWSHVHIPNSEGKPALFKYSIDGADVTTLIECPAQPPWRNRLARSAVNRKVGGSSPPGGAWSFFCFVT